MAVGPQRAFTDPTGYIGPLRYLEVMLGSKFRPGSGLWAEANDLMVMVWDAAFVSRRPFQDSHGQLAHYARSFDLFDKDDPERQAELSARLDEIPHLADFHVDIDFDGDLGASREQAVKLVEHYLSLGVPEAAVGIRFSGRKGFDVMVPWQVLGVQRQGVIGLNWNAYKRLAQALIDKLDLQGVDMGLYRRNGTIRLENTVHPSGLYKVRLTPRELRGDLDSILKLAEKPRRPLYSAEQEEAARAASVVGLRSLYLVAQAQADAETMHVRELRQVPLDVVVEGLTPCLSNILAQGPVRGTRNETLFHAAMMLKHIGRSQEEAEDYGRQWLGPAYHTEGGPSTIRSAYHGPFAGGCRWMREHGFAVMEECRACPVGQRRYERDARVVDGEPKVSVGEAELPTLAEQRAQLERDFDSLSPHHITVARTPAGLGKAQPLDAKVLTPSGFVKMGDLKVGDLVAHPSGGEPSRVIAVHPQGRVPIYRVTFTDGSSTEACGEHLWLTQTRLDRTARAKRRPDGSREKPRGRPGSTKSTLELAATLMYANGGRGTFNHSIPLVSPSPSPDISLPITPWLMGFLLGGGSTSRRHKSLRFCATLDSDVPELVNRHLPEGMSVVQVRQKEWRIAPAPGCRDVIGDAWQNLGLRGVKSADRWIPEAYFHASPGQRLELLRGLMDSDGGVELHGKTLLFHTSSLALADGFTRLLQSLGGVTTRRVKRPGYWVRGERREGAPFYTLSPRFPGGINPFRVKRKAALYTSKAQPTRRVAAVEFVGEKEAQCITVSNPDGLYITDDYIVTHNSHAALRKSTQVVEQSGRTLWFVKDTLKADGLAADMRDELREVHGYTGKVQVLYGRNEHNCDNWSEVEKVEKRGYSAGKVVCPGCAFRNSCDYYGQYEAAYEPGIYIAPHAMLPLIFDDERRGFSREFVHHDDDELGSVPIGGPLKLIVIDEDALDVLIERYWIGSYHLEGELRHKNRWIRDALTKRKNRRVVLDKNWLQIVEWLQAAIRVPGPLLPALNSVAKADGKMLRATFEAIDESRIIDPDFDIHRGHKPFTERLYLALRRELPRLKDGNFTIWAKGNGLEVLSMRPIAFPPGIPVVVLDAYANEDIYRRFYRAAGVNRLPAFLDYPVRERPNVTYVLGANLLSSDLERAQQGKAYAVSKIEKIMQALQALTSDGVETYLVAKRSFFDSEVWKRWEPKLPNCVAEGDAGQLYFWRGRGINAASGKRVAVLQTPNFHPDSVMQEASVLFADEPRLDDQRVRVEDDMVWAPDAENPRAIKVDRTVYADDRLNLVNERYRMDELVQMAFRSRSLTTGAEIIVFADLPDPRLPARRVFTLAELVEDESARAEQSRRVVYQVMRELDVLTVQNLEDLGIVGGQPKPTPLRRVVRDACPDEFRIARDHPVDIETARKEMAGL